ncbi:amidohydrolase family protein [Brevundimonas sp.]|uniref:amidohydrolase family protein n=1 Tax=Brevundimonas sp. TaxID=1871086 RepID=UPI0025BA28F9|nr:amidohydrolase family protein [Brevundimonas sp.]
MKPRLFSALAAAVLLLGVEPGIAQTRTTYLGATLLDPATETVRPDAYLVVEDGRIVEVGQGRPNDPGVIQDVKGLYALPGLIDTHAHITLGPSRVGTDDNGPYLEALDRPDIVAHNAARLLAYGVTTVRNPGGDGVLNRRYDADRKAGVLVGPEALHAGEVIDRSAFPFRGLVTRPSETLSITEIIRRQAEGGARYIKLYEALSEADLGEGITAAHAHGLPAIGHLSDVSWSRAARMGIDALVHMMPISPELLPADRRDDYVADRKLGGFAFYQWFEAADFDAPEIVDMIQTLARHRVHVDATLIAFQPAYWGDDAAVLDRDVEIIHPDMRANWDQGFRFDAGWEPQDYARAKVVWPKVLELTRRMYAAGVPMTIGTDMANPYIAPGISVAREMALHQQAGIPAWAVLRMATSDAASILKLDARLGTLAVGKEADIVFLGADPLDSIDAMTDVRMVVADGQVVDREGLLGL